MFLSCERCRELEVFQVPMVSQDEVDSLEIPGRMESSEISDPPGQVERTVHREQEDSQDEGWES